MNTVLGLQNTILNPTVNPKSCGRVLTSWESIQQLEQNKVAKEQKQHEKEEREKTRLEKTTGEGKAEI